MEYSFCEAYVKTAVSVNKFKYSCCYSRRPALIGPFKRCCVMWLKKKNIRVLGFEPKRFIENPWRVRRLSADFPIQWVSRGGGAYRWERVRGLDVKGAGLVLVRREGGERWRLRSTQRRRVVWRWRNTERVAAAVRRLRDSCYKQLFGRTVWLHSSFSLERS